MCLHSNRNPVKILCKRIKSAKDHTNVLLQYRKRKLTKKNRQTDIDKVHYAQTSTYKAPKRIL